MGGLNLLVVVLLPAMAMGKDKFGLGKCNDFEADDSASFGGLEMTRLALDTFYLLAAAEPTYSNADNCISFTALNGFSGIRDGEAFEKVGSPDIVEADLGLPITFPYMGLTKNLMGNPKDDGKLKYSIVSLMDDQFYVFKSCYDWLFLKWERTYIAMTDEIPWAAFESDEGAAAMDRLLEDLQTEHGVDFILKGSSELCP